MALYKQGDFVQVLEGNEWVLAYVVSMGHESNPIYHAQLMTDGRMVEHSTKTMKPGQLDMGDDQFAPPAVKPKIPVIRASKRFGTIQKTDLNDLEMAAKAKNTHRQTTWGVCIFTGRN